ncbi:MAG TPA: DUF4292 domain-containing protein, partial [Flavitalea sp.]|nr:DUF4292 domain-containing protein [Flavitalea sp.]
VVDSTVDRKADSIRFINLIYAAIDSNKINFKTFSAKVKVDFEGKDGKKSDFNANIRLYKDSVMWISINALLGIEAFRVLITPDSVKVLNKLDKVVQLRSVNYLQEVAKIPFTFKELQELLIGNPIFLDSNILSYRREINGITLVSVGQLFKHFLMVNSNNYLPIQSKLDDIDPTRTRTCYIGYGDYQNKNNKRFSAFRKITVVETSKLDIEMQFKQIDFNVDLNIPFTIPKNYKRE